MKATIAARLEWPDGKEYLSGFPGTNLFMGTGRRLLTNALSTAMSMITITYLDMS